MIRKVTFSNFYSFKNKQTIDFIAQKKDSYDYYNSKVGDQITKVVTFIGGNASGKTNVMRLFSFLGHFLTTTRKEVDLSKSHIAYKTFFDSKRPSIFEIEFETSSRIFKYYLKLQNNIVKNESIIFKNIELNAKPITLFIRKDNTIVELNKKYMTNVKVEYLPAIRADISFIPFLKSLYDIDIINQIFFFFHSFNTNINEQGKKDSIFYQVNAIQLYEKEPTLKKKMQEIIRNFDIGLSDFNITKEIKGEHSYVSRISGVHNTEKGKKLLKFTYESSGTKHLFFILAKMLRALKENGVAIMDEMEVGLHIEALNKLITYFLDEDEKNEAQLIFSSQSLGILSKLDQHQIYLVDKNSSGESNITRLSKVENIRSDDNFLNRYLAGKYGAYPKIKL